MTNSDPLVHPRMTDQKLDYDSIDPESFVLYRGKYGDVYHQNPEHATNPDIPTSLDAANDALERVEMYRVSEVEATADTLCSQCAKQVRKALGVHND